MVIPGRVESIALGRASVAVAIGIAISAFALVALHDLKRAALARFDGARRTAERLDRPPA